MTQEHVQWGVITLLVVGLTATSIYSLVLGGQQKHYAASVAVPAVVFESFSQRFVRNAEGEVDFLIFNHACSGRVIPALYFPGIDTAAQPDVSYCVGENVLTVKGRNDRNESIIDTRVVDDPDDAPLLLSTEVVPTQDGVDRVILVSYAPDTCKTLGDCGVGTSAYFVTGAYSTTAHAYRALKYFPRSGTPVWNPSGTFALFYPNSAGGAGYGESKIVGYDLERDLQLWATEEEAAWDKDGAEPFDVEGNPLPAWTDITWEDDERFILTLRNTDGTSEQIEGNVDHLLLTKEGFDDVPVGSE